MYLDVNRKEIEAHVISTPESLRTRLKTLLTDATEYGKFVVGFDTIQSVGEITLLNLASSSYCLIIQLRSFRDGSLPSELAQFLQLPEISFVGVGIKSSVDALERLYKVRCRNAFDLNELACYVTSIKRLRGCGLQSLAVGVGVAKKPSGEKTPGVVVGDWDVPTLRKLQIECAVADAHLAFLIGQELLKPGRWDQE